MAGWGVITPAIAAVQSYPLAPVSPEAYTEAQTPTTYCIIDGHRVVPHSWQVESNAHGASDTATVALPISNGPDWTTAIYRGDLTGNADEPVYIQIFAGLNQPLLRFWGVVDIYSGRLSGGQDGDTITFQCRSLAAPLMTTKITTPFAGANMTTVQFIEQQALRFGLNYNVNVVNTPLTMQQVLGNEFATGVKNRGIWDLMLQCALQDDVDLWVDGNTIWYVTPSALSRNTVDLKWMRDVLDVEFSHAPQFSKNIQVEVRSYVKRVKQSSFSRTRSGANGLGTITTSGSRTVTSSPQFGTTQNVTTTISNTGATSTTVTNTTGGNSIGTASAPAAFSGREVYTFYVKNKTPQQCADLANKFWRQISQHEFSVTINLPVTSKKLGKVTRTSLVRLHGTPFAYVNTTYWPRRITETFSPTEGWNWSLECINHENPQGHE